MKESSKLLLFLLALSLCTPQHAVAVERPIATDSRIRTLVYSENDVFRVVVQYGYQTVIEFAQGEEVQMISSGNNYAWTLTPKDRRLFIKPLEDNVMTNMTIITNMRTYQFELQSKPAVGTLDEELAYVIRFFYPDDAADQIKPEIILKSEVTSHLRANNFNYTISGPDSIAPIKIFDNGTSTSFEFDRVPSNLKFEVKSESGDFIAMQPQQKGSTFVLNTTAQEFTLSSGRKVVHVYNEDYKTTVR